MKRRTLIAAILALPVPALAQSGNQPNSNNGAATRNAGQRNSNTDARDLKQKNKKQSGNIPATPQQQPQGQQQ